MRTVETAIHPEDEGRYSVKELRPVNPDDPRQLAMIRTWLKDPKNARHLVGVPERLQDLAHYYREEVHGFLGVNELGEYVSVGALRDPGDPNRITRTYSPNLERLCVRPDMQQHGIGRQTTLLLLEKAFVPKEEGGFEYDKIGLGIIVGPKDWEHPRDLFFGLGFQHTGYHHGEVPGLPKGNGDMVRYDVLTMEMGRSFYFSVHRPQPPQARPSF